jgi:diguanylate cyclase (GGDEF)-like protein
LEDRTEQVYKIAALDGLTGLYNRQCGEQRLVEEMSRSQRHGSPLTIILVDLNGLKRINDTLGHAAGDLALRYFAERLQKAVRGSDVPIRLGGDEFLILLPECKLSEVHLVLNRLDGLTVEFEEHTIPLEFAAGWTNYIAGEAPQVMMRRADELLYANKRGAKKPGKEETGGNHASGHESEDAGNPSSEGAREVRMSASREREVIPIPIRGQNSV